MIKPRCKVLRIGATEPGSVKWRCRTRDCLENARLAQWWPTLCAMESRRYPTDLSDDEWLCIRPHLPEPTGQGRPRRHGLRKILNAVFYVLKSGCPWRVLPREFPPWKTVYDWFRKWRIDGTWERLNAELRERLRCRLGRDPDPSAAIVDSQSARTSGAGGQQRGFDPAKQVEGRKRHLLVDTEGLVLKALPYTALKSPTKTA
jgi:putative transposase